MTQPCLVCGQPADPPDRPLILHAAVARRTGATEEEIERAATRALRLAGPAENVDGCITTSDAVKASSLWVKSEPARMPYLRAF